MADAAIQGGAVHGLAGSSLHGKSFVLGGTSLRVRWVHSVALCLRERNAFRAPHSTLRTSNGPKTKVSGYVPQLPNWYRV